MKSPVIGKEVVKICVTSFMNDPLKRRKEKKDLPKNIVIRKCLEARRQSYKQNVVLKTQNFVFFFGVFLILSHTKLLVTI